MKHRKMQHLASSIYRFNNFKVKSNSLMNGGLRPPTIYSNYVDGIVCVQHREYIGDIYSASDFKTQAFELNPGMELTFPWLAQIATAFEEYQWKGMVFEFKSMSSDAILSGSSSAALGTVIMATQYNALSAPFTNKGQMENYVFANSCKPSMNMVHPVECRSQFNPQSMLYVRNTNSFTGDKRLYDLGSFQIAVQGCQGDVGVIGELWVNFEVCFYKPKYQPGIGGGNIDVFQIPFTIGNNLITAPTTGKPLGNADATGNTHFQSPIQMNPSLGGTINTANQTYTFPSFIEAGFYLINYTLQIPGNPTLTTAPSITGLTNCALFVFPVNNTTWTYGSNSTSGNPTTYILSEMIYIVSPNASFTVSGGVWTGGTAASATLLVTQLNGSLGNPSVQ